MSGSRHWSIQLFSVVKHLLKRGSFPDSEFSQLSEQRRYGTVRCVSFGFAVGELSHERCPARFSWARASPRWCPKVVSSPGGLISAGPSSLRRSSSSISNAVEPSGSWRWNGLVHVVVHVKSSNQYAGTHCRILRFPLIPYNFSLLAPPKNCSIVLNKSRVLDFSTVL